MFDRTSLMPALASAMATAVLATTASPTLASSHAEAPFIKSLPKVDGTDFYMFRSYEPGRTGGTEADPGYVTIIANYWPLQAPIGGPSYFTMDPDALYEVHIDNNGDAVEDITYQFQFNNTLGNSGNGITLNIGGQDVAVPLEYAGPITAAGTTGRTAPLNMFQTYTVTQVTGDRRNEGSAVTWGNNNPEFRKPYDNVGEKTFPDYDAYVGAVTTTGQPFFNAALPGCDREARIFVGQRQESFSLALGEIFDLVNFVPVEGAVEASPDRNDLERLNITSFALELPVECVTQGDETVIGAWTTASVRQVRVMNPNPTFEFPQAIGGAWTQVSRLSAPLVNEVVIGLPDKDRFNTSEPVNDANAADADVPGFGVYVTNPTLPVLLNVLFGDAAQPPTNLPRQDLVTAFLTGFPGVNQPSGVVASEMLRLNTAIAPTLREEQSNFGVVAGDLAGFPNGRRLGDDEVDIALRVVMGALCHQINVDLDGSGTAGDEGDNLMLCGGNTAAENEAAAPSGDTPYTDGAPQSALRFGNTFPYVNSPVPGSPQAATRNSAAR